MPKAVQIRYLDHEVYAGLVRRAGEAGVSVPELLRAECSLSSTSSGVRGRVRGLRSACW